jgi:hypothetical protein
MAASDLAPVAEVLISMPDSCNCILEDSKSESWIRSGHQRISALKLEHKETVVMLPSSLVEKEAYSRLITITNV